MGQFTVTSVTDAPDIVPGDGICADVTGQCTLRAAIQESNALAGDDTIFLPAGSYRLEHVGMGEDKAATGDLDILDNVTLIGDGASATFVDGGRRDRVFQIGKLDGGYVTAKL
ncbi:MAG: CSLREA domain-containing protein [Deltaproteobacteria bacterium]|nr:CSLREA domain-containing protein [Deltaproteobacteria bacterium]